MRAGNGEGTYYTLPNLPRPRKSSRPLDCLQNLKFLNYIIN